MGDGVVMVRLGGRWGWWPVPQILPRLNRVELPRVKKVGPQRGRGVGLGDML